MKIAPGHTAVIGRSFSGKTSLGFHIAGLWKQNKCNNIKNIYVLNASDPSLDVPNFAKHLPWTEFYRKSEQSLLINNCAVLVEDIFNINGFAEESLLFALNYAARRQNVTLILITHRQEYFYLQYRL